MPKKRFAEEQSSLALCRRFACGTAGRVDCIWRAQRARAARRRAKTSSASAPTMIEPLTMSW